MMAFRYPPPPPAPPKATSSDDYRSSPSQRGNNIRGRGWKGQSRGGNHVSDANGARVGGHHQERGQSYAYGNFGGRGGQHNTRGGQKGGFSSSNHANKVSRKSFPRNDALSKYSSHQPEQSQHGNQTTSQDQPQPLVNSNALLQAISFISTPAGQQSMAAFANHMAGVEPVNISSVQTSPQPSYYHSDPVHPPLHAGQKRKFHECHQNQPDMAKKGQQQVSSKPPRAKAAVPPTIPSFGFSLPKQSVVRPAPAQTPQSHKNKRHQQVELGLTNHALPDNSSGGEEDVDEEAAYASKLKDGGFVFEHDGELVSIKSIAEVAAWVKDRRKNFPTQSRIREKVEEARAIRTVELEFLRRVQSRPPKEDVTPQEDELRSKRHEKKKKKKKKKNPQWKFKQDSTNLEQLPKKDCEVVTRNRAEPKPIDLGLGYDSATDSDSARSILSKSSALSDSEESSSEFESGTESEASNEAPVSVSSKVNPVPVQVPPPPRVTKPRQDRSTTDQVCSSWQEAGRCRWSNKCKFAHPPKREKKTGLYEVLVEQELVKADQLALDAIKYLGKHGFLG